MQLKRVLTFALLLSIMLTGVLPVFAADTATTTSAPAQVGPDYIGDYLANLPDGWGSIRPGDLNTALAEEAPILVDVREDNEWAEGFIPGAIHIPVRSIAQHLDLLPDLDAPIVVYCAAGTRGAIAMVSLQVLGYTNVRNLVGGIGAWTGEGYEVTTEEVAVEAGEAPDIAPELVADVDNYLTNVLPEGWGQIRPDGLAELLASDSPPFMLDVREPDELLDGTIGDAVNIPIRTIGDHLDELPMDQQIIVYCAAGTRGGIATVALQMLGYDVLNLAGGFRGWVSAGYEVTGVETLDMEARLPYVQSFLNNIPEGFASVGVDTLNEELAGDAAPFLLDVREPNELAENGVIPGAVNVPIRSIAQHLDMLPADLNAPVVVYCAAGTRGALAMSALRILGYTDVRNLSGGFGAWAEAGYEVAEAAVVPEAGGAEIEDGLVQAMNMYLVRELPDGWGLVTADDLFLETLEAEIFLLDVREAPELEADGYIADSVHVPLREVADNLDLLPADMDTPIVVYCKGGYRGALAMVGLQFLGYTDVRNLRGGFVGGWAAGGYPYEGGAPVEEAAEEEGAEEEAMEVTLPEGEILPVEVVTTAVADYWTNLPQGFASVDTGQLNEVLDQVFVLDVRSDAEYAEGFIPGAVNVPIRELAQHLDMLPSFDTPIAVYCGSGHRSAIAAMSLSMLGYENVVSMRLGFNAWEFETTQDAPEVEMGAFPAVDADLWTTVDAYLAALPDGYGGVAPGDVNLELESITLIDVREPSEYEAGHLEGAINMPIRELGSMLEDIPTDAPIVVYGWISHRGALAMTGLQMIGFEDVRSMGAGTTGWEANGYPFVTE